MSGCTDTAIQGLLLNLAVSLVYLGGQLGTACRL